MGNITHKSLIDYFLATTSFCNSVVAARVTDSHQLSVSSDHSTLLLRLTESTQVNILQVRANPFKRIKNWSSFQTTLESKLHASKYWFSSLSTTEKGSWLSEQIKAAGRSSIGSLNFTIPSSHKKKSRLTSLHKQTLVYRSRLRIIRRSPLPNNRLVKSLRRKLDYLITKRDAEKRRHQWSRKLKIRRAIHAGGPAGSKLFWEFVSCKSKSATVISALADNGSLVNDQDSINAVIDNAFKKKFNCSTSPPISRYFHHPIYASQRKEKAYSLE